MWIFFKPLLKWEPHCQNTEDCRPVSLGIKETTMNRNAPTSCLAGDLCCISFSFSLYPNFLSSCYFQLTIMKMFQKNNWKSTKESNNSAVSLPCSESSCQYRRAALLMKYFSSSAPQKAQGCCWLFDLTHMFVSGRLLYCSDWRLNLVWQMVCKLIDEAPMFAVRVVKFSFANISSKFVCAELWLEIQYYLVSLTAVSLSGYGTLKPTTAWLFFVL